MDESDEQLRQWLDTRDAELFFTKRSKESGKLMREDDESPPKETSIEYTKFLRDMRKLRRQGAMTWLGTSFAYLCVFCAASLLLCFVLWVASCTLNAMKGV